MSAKMRMCVRRNIFKSNFIAHSKNDSLNYIYYKLATEEKALWLGSAGPFKTIGKNCAKVATQKQNR